MKIKIEYGIEKGKRVMNVIDLNNPDEKVIKHIISRELTGTTGESGDGIFELYEEENNKETWVNFQYGNFDNNFIIPSIIEEDYEVKLIKVIKEIRAWVKSIDFKKSMEINTELFED